MSVTARRCLRSISRPDVLLYTGLNYTGNIYPLRINAERPIITTPFNENIRSVKFLRPCKVYLYEDADRSGAILYLDGAKDIPDTGVYYYQSDWPFSGAISSIEVKPASYVAPIVPAQPTLSFSGGYTMPVLTNSNRYSNTTVKMLTYDIQDQATHTAFMAKMGATSADQTTNDTRILAILNQIIRNVCSLLYRNSDEQPVRYPLTALHFVTSTQYYAWAKPASSDVFIGNLLTNESPGFIIAGLAHELTHSYGHNKFYGQTGQEKVTGTCEGIAMHTMIHFGFMPVRPTGGGVNWYDGYETTAMFFDYIVRSSPAPEPDFIYKLNMTMNAANPAIGKTYWSDAIIQTLNSRNMTVDQLWTEYKAWEAAGAI